MLNRHSFLYRFIGITLAFSVLGLSILLPIASSKDLPKVVFYSVLGVYLGLYVLVIVLNEVYVYWRKKNGKNIHKGK